MFEQIDARKQKILKAVVQRYMLTGRPVGSRAVAETCDLHLSAATIRNEMAALEKMGLLYQPHTSAGRMPTDVAYRYYVDLLLVEPKPSGQEAEEIKRLLADRSREIEGLLKEVSILLSRLTHTAAMVFAPTTHAETIKHVDLVRLSENRVMVVIITGNGEMGRRFLNLRRRVSEDTVQRVVRFLDASLSGKSMSEIDLEALKRQTRFRESGLALVESAINAVVDYLGTMDEMVFIGGTANIVREMSYAGIKWVEALLEALERQYFIIDLLKDLIIEKDLTVRIGEENRAWELQKFAFVGKSYPVAPGLLGSLGVVGPTCMDYARTISMVQYMADSLGRKLLGQSD